MNIPQDASYKPIEAELLAAARAIIAHTNDHAAWAQFRKDHPSLVRGMRDALNQDAPLGERLAVALQRI